MLNARSPQTVAESDVDCGHCTEEEEEEEEIFHTVHICGSDRIKDNVCVCVCVWGGGGFILSIVLMGFLCGSVRLTLCVCVCACVRV